MRRNSQHTHSRNCATLARATLTAALLWREHTHASVELETSGEHLIVKPLSVEAPCP